MRRKVYGAIIVALDTQSVLIIRELIPREMVRYGFPKGKIDIGESREDCITREVREEVGINLKKAIYRQKLNSEVDLVIFEKRPKVIMGKEISKYFWVPISEIESEGTKYNCFYRRNIKRGKNEMNKLLEETPQLRVA